MGQFRKMLRKLNFLRKIQSIYALSKYVDIPKTLYWNFKLFPWEIAKQRPLYLGYNADIRCVRGAVKIKTQEIYPGMVQFGISRYPSLPVKGVSTLLRLGKGSQLILGKEIEINRGCSLVATYSGQIEIGDDVFMNQGTILYSNSKITIGNHCSIGWNCQLYDSAIHYMIDLETGLIQDVKKPISIGNNVWIANHATIAPGAKIPPFTTVAALSLVNKDFTQTSYVGGILVGAPAIYKDSKKVRLLSENLQHQLKSNIFSNRKEISLQDLNVSQYPLNPDLNKLYHK